MKVTLNIHFNFSFPQKGDSKKRHCYYANCRFQVPQESMLASHLSLSIRLHPGGLRGFTIPIHKKVYHHPCAELTAINGMENGYFDLSYYKEFDNYGDGNRILSILKKGGDSRFSALQKSSAEVFDRGKRSDWFTSPLPESSLQDSDLVGAFYLQLKTTNLTHETLFREMVVFV